LLCPCLADGPRPPGRRSVLHVFVPCSSCSCSPSVSIRRGFEFWLDGVSDGPQQRADGPRVPGGQSACSLRTVRYSGASLLVLCALSDGPRRRAGQSVGLARTVGGFRSDGPRGQCGRSALPAGRSARACELCFLVRFLPSFLVLPCVLQGIVPKARG
jgi:hypothetical protein